MLLAVGATYGYEIMKASNPNGVELASVAAWKTELFNPFRVDSTKHFDPWVAPTANQIQVLRTF